jgi:chloramphenicol O-acetyltransferase type A
MKTIIDMESWKRKEHFQHFSACDDPYWGVTVHLDFTSVYKEAKENGDSFFLYSLHKLMLAVNEIEEFRYRIEYNKVVSYDVVHVSPTIGREDGTFGFAFLEFNPDRDIFIQKAEPTIENVKNASGLIYNDDSSRPDLIHFSSLPWIPFTDMKLASMFFGKDSIPKISTGKLVWENGKAMLPVFISVHHGLMDGFHVGQFLKYFE